MATIKTYQLQQEFDCPYVRYTGHPKNPNQICKRKFRKGELVRGELKYSNDKPAFVLSDGAFVFPLSVLKEVITKEVVSNADAKQESKPAAIAPPKTNKIMYVDATVLGAIAGFLVVFALEKYGKIQPDPTHKHKIYGMMAGVGLALYLAYRHANNIKVNLNKD